MAVSYSFYVHTTATLSGMASRDMATTPETRQSQKALILFLLILLIVLIILLRLVLFSASSSYYYSCVSS